MRPIQNVLVARSLRPLADWLMRGGVGWLLIAAGFFLLVCVCTFFLWRRDLNISSDISIDTLTEEFEETKQAHKGLEAFVLSGLGEEIKNKLDSTPVTQEFVDAFNGLQAAVRQPETRPLPELEVRPTPPTNVDITEKFITNQKGGEGGEGFLYIPGMVVGAWVPADAGNDVIVEKVKNISHVGVKDGVKVVEKHDGVLRDNIAASEKAAPHLKRFLDAPELIAKQSMLEPYAVQSYFLSATGLIRITRKGVPDVHDYYLSQFPPTTFFPDRPYFWKVFEGSRSDDSKEPLPIKPGNVGELFKITDPYIDLGGNGVVVTLSRKLEGLAVKSGVFLDFSLGPAAEKRITEKITSLSGLARRTTWRVEGSEVYRGAGEEALPDGHEKALREAIKARIVPGKLSEIYGQLFVLIGGREGDKKVGTVAFTVPVAPAEYRDQKSQNGQMQPANITLLYCRLDLDSFQWWVLFKAVVIAVSFAAFVFFVVLLVVDYKKRLREQEKALESFGRVMAQAPVAYCRVNERDEFIEMNEAFATLLGYESLEAARTSLVNKQTFEELLADEKSSRMYGDILDKRRNRVPTDPYRVRLRGQKGKEVVDVRVYGASVPMPKSHPKANPQTFGIVLEVGGQMMSSGAMSVKPVFGLPKEPSKPADLFVLMKFAREFDPVYESITDVAERLKLVAVRADRILSTKAVMSEVWASINAARILIADCTGLNPNVFYEIGIAHVIGKPVILITQNEQDVPFNISHLRHIPYRVDTPKGMKQFERELEEIVKCELRLGAS
ncbi:MAG TPA: PAS domain-containing protein [Pyrinomonadaceae bacterium]